ncbi:DUF882 domain-containing protein [Thalassobaculum salexigens]|uniref:DUF882 domain-containing protein n=1 Tax=Thalassobaculum salexigens TaxID=455360 RepID=UPI00057082D2|nr:DUF882 domain-containing protein [Thalassobaculum salexigens]
MTEHFASSPRRRVTRRAALGALALLMTGGTPARSAIVAAHDTRKLKIEHLHTDERLDITYFRNGRYDTEALRKINYCLRDHRDGTVHAIDTRVLDYLHDLTFRLDITQRIGIVCGYRSPKTNEALRANSSGVAKRSLHMQGMALDIRVPGLRVSTIAKAAIAMNRGGVGLYSRSNFVHIDCGEARTWGA